METGGLYGGKQEVGGYSRLLGYVRKRANDSLHTLPSSQKILLQSYHNVITHTVTQGNVRCGTTYLYVKRVSSEREVTEMGN